MALDQGLANVIGRQIHSGRVRPNSEAGRHPMARSGMEQKAPYVKDAEEPSTEQAIWLQSILLPNG